MRFKEIKEAYEDHVWDDFISSGSAGNLLKSFGNNIPDLLKKFPMLKGIINAKPDDPEAVSNPAQAITGAPTNGPTNGPTKGARSSTASTPSNKGKTSTRSSPANAQQIASYLASKGLSRQHVAGIMTNIKHESNFNPGAIGDGGTSGGLFQHHGPRFQAMVRAAGPNWKTNWKGQIDFALSEPAGRQYTSIPFKTAQEASRWFTINFEIPANKVARANDRSRAASQFA